MGGGCKGLRGSRGKKLEPRKTSCRWWQEAEPGGLAGVGALEVQGQGMVGGGRPSVSYAYSLNRGPRTHRQRVWAAEQSMERRGGGRMAVRGHPACSLEDLRSWRGQTNLGVAQPRRSLREERISKGKKAGRKVGDTALDRQSLHTEGPQDPLRGEACPSGGSRGPGEKRSPKGTQLWYPGHVLCPLCRGRKRG